MNGLGSSSCTVNTFPWIAILKYEWIPILVRHGLVLLPATGGGSPTLTQTCAPRTPAGLARLVAVASMPPPRTAARLPILEALRYE